MHQENLWASEARCTGIVIRYSIDWTADTAAGLFVATPTWSKKPRQSGDVRLALDESTYDCAQDLAFEAVRGVSRTDPGDYIPYYCNRQLKDYKYAASHQFKV